MQEHEEGRHDQEDEVGHGVEELGDERGEGVVLLAPVHGRAPPAHRQRHPHDKQTEMKISRFFLFVEHRCRELQIHSV